ncbi:hypothetical protein QL285_053785 [Trifolium repens]|nr:hypothetical protein QL285_053785 [Trifolium repens]
MKHFNRPFDCSIALRCVFKVDTLEYKQLFSIFAAARSTSTRFRNSANASSSSFLMADIPFFNSTFTVHISSSIPFIPSATSSISFFNLLASSSILEILASA